MAMAGYFLKKKNCHVKEEEEGEGWIAAVRRVVKKKLQTGSRNLKFLRMIGYNIRL